MTDHNQSPEELEAHLTEHLQFLRASADAYDGGFEEEAKRIAVSVRVLVYDTGRSKSLLGQLGLKDQNFIDSASPLVPGNMSTHSGLVVTAIVPGFGAKYVAFLDEPPHGQLKRVEFINWWETPIFIDSAKRTLSRRDLVLAVANQDGGVHVDPALNATYADLSRNNSLACTYSDGNRSEPVGRPERAALRQIGHEVLKTMIPNYEKQPTYPDGGLVVGGMVTLQGEDAHAQGMGLTDLVSSKRNERCPCGSGIRYKRCCGTLV